MRLQCDNVICMKLLCKPWSVGATAEPVVLPRSCSTIAVHSARPPSSENLQSHWERKRHELRLLGRKDSSVSASSVAFSHPSPYLIVAVLMIFQGDL